MFKRKTAEQKAQDLAILELAKEAAREYFKARNVPTWSNEFYYGFPAFTRAYVHSYKKSQRLNEGRLI